MYEYHVMYVHNSASISTELNSWTDEGWTLSSFVFNGYEYIFILYREKLKE